MNETAARATCSRLWRTCLTNRAHVQAMLTHAAHTRPAFAAVPSQATQQPLVRSHALSSASQLSACFSRASSAGDLPSSWGEEVGSVDAARPWLSTAPATSVLFDLDVSVPSVSMSLQSSSALSADHYSSAERDVPYILAVQLQNVAVMLRASTESESQRQHVSCSATHACVLKLQAPERSDYVDASRLQGADWQWPGRPASASTLELVPAMQTLCATISGNSAAAYQLRRPRHNQLRAKAFAAWLQYVKVRAMAPLIR